MRKSLISSLLLLSLSAPSLAMPTLVTSSEVNHQTYELIEELQINGDIRDSLNQLVSHRLEGKDSDVYVIEDIKEDTFKDTLTVVVRLYNVQDVYTNQLPHRYEL
ncbi:hypothetical protein [Thaumasiovibrio sp. DFM-14]|uniref:hypothetical protein n=1 Tax=Thaumasiovibrio sp. DFM-14 TaxID=3384792 RepID=UPI0039A0069D